MVGAGTSEGGMSGCIVGWAHSKFGKHEGREIESLIVEVTQAALADAGVAAADIDTVYLGTMNGGFVRQEFPASLVFQADPGFRFKPATRVEDACATGSAAIHQGLNAIAAGRARMALVVGVEKMTEVSGAQVGDSLPGASYRKEEDAIERGCAGARWSPSRGRRSPGNGHSPPPVSHWTISIWLRPMTASRLPS